MDRLSYTSDGFYWIGGAKGLFRLNGETAEKIVLRDESGILDRDNIIQSQVIEDDKGKLWFSTFSSLYRYDPIVDRMSKHPIESNGLQLNRDYRPFYFDNERQELWLRAGDRLWAYNTVTNAHRPLTEKSTATQYSVFSLADGSKRISGARWMLPGLELMIIKPGAVSAKVLEVAPTEKVICALQINVDSIALGTKQGLRLINLSTDSLTTSFFKEDRRNDNVTSLLKTKFGKIFVSYTNTGIVAIGTENVQEITSFGSNIKGKKRETDQLLFGPNQQLVATQINGNIQVIQQDLIAFREPIPQDVGPVAGMILNGVEEVSILTESGHLWEKTGDNKWLDAFRSVSDDRLPKTGAIDFANDSIFILGGSNFWVLTESTRQHFNKPNSIVDRIMAHASNSRIAITDEGLSTFGFYNGQLKLTQHSEIIPPDKALLKDLYPLNDTAFLLNILPSEIWRNTLTQEGWKLTEKINGIGDIYCAAEHSSGTVYAGGSQGFFRLENGQGQEVPLKINQLAAPQVQTIAEDDTGNLWLGTTEGLLSWNPTTKETRYFSESDGLHSSRFTDVAPITLPNGEIWMATDAGVVAFQPKELLKREHHRDPYIAKIWTNEEPLQSDTSSHYLKRLELNYLRNTLKFKVAAKGFGRSAASGIRYQMLGYEEKPAYTDFNTTIRYPNLPPGEYTLQLTAINQNGLPSGVRELAVIIQPPFKQTLAFKLLVGFGLVLLIGGGYAILLSRERQRQRRIQEQQARLAAERDRIAGEVHDDLGGQLSSIMYLSEELLLTQAAPGTERELNRINELSRNSLQNVRDIIFALDNRRGSIADLGEQLRGTGQEFFGDRNITFKYEEELEQPDYVLSSRQKRNLLLITKEAWHNTAKHANATTVQLQFKQSGTGLQLLIRDDGSGFDNPEPNSSTGGYGLDNMQEKAASIGGEARIQSAVGKGTSLTISAPLKPET